MYNIDVVEHKATLETIHLVFWQISTRKRVGQEPPHPSSPRRKSEVKRYVENAKNKSCQANEYIKTYITEIVFN